MTLAFVQSRAATGVDAPVVRIEVHLSAGMPGFNIVGLPEKAVKESKDRVRSAIINCGFDFPVRKIIVNLAPADLPKQGARFDLGIAIGILAASAQIPVNCLSDYEFAGELQLSGKLRPVSGMLPFANSCQADKRTLVTSLYNAKECALIDELVVLGADSLLEVCAHLQGRQKIQAQGRTEPQKPEGTILDLSDVCGQDQAKRALEIAAAGEHSLLMIGPPGTGKTMLSSRLVGILPNMQQEESMAAASIYSISQQGFNIKHWGQRPFRSPHHSASAVAVVGGGSPPRPGEITLAHHGVLFLDELPEFNRQVIDALREPLEAGKITISRAGWQVQFPATFQLVAAMNPCPCGYLSEGTGRCRCSTEQVQRYQSKISGPILDRIDMHVEVLALKKGELNQKQNTGESSKIIKERVITARELQYRRANKSNARLKAAEVGQYCQLSPKDQQFFEASVERLKLSARSYHRLLKISRSIADLGNSECIQRIHLEEAFFYRAGF